SSVTFDRMNFHVGAAVIRIEHITSAPIEAQMARPAALGANGIEKAQRSRASVNCERAHTTRCATVAYVQVCTVDPDRDETRVWGGGDEFGRSEIASLGGEAGGHNAHRVGVLSGNKRQRIGRGHGFSLVSRAARTFRAAGWNLNALQACGESLPLGRMKCILPDDGAFRQ